MPEEIVARILRLPGYGIAGWALDEGAHTLTLSIRQTAAEPYSEGQDADPETRPRPRVGGE